MNDKSCQKSVLDLKRVIDSVDDGEKKAGLEGVYISFLGWFVVRQSDLPLS